MAKVNQLVCILGFLLCFAMSARADWCIAVTAAPEGKLQAFLDYACGKYDCSAIKPGGQCFQPNTIQNHGSYALDLHFRHTGNCLAGLGTPALNDPSWGSCHYP